MVELFREPAEQIPFWMSISKHFAEEKWHKKSDEKTIGEIYQLIRKGKFVCGTCNSEIDLTLPKTFEELSSIVSQVINPSTSYCCDKCMLEDWDKGRVLGAEEGFLDDIKQARKTVGGNGSS